jgi:periplasmic protein CpxP/Spy
VALLTLYLLPGRAGFLIGVESEGDPAFAIKFEFGNGDDPVKNTIILRGSLAGRAFVLLIATILAGLGLGLGTAIAQDNQEQSPQGPPPGMGEHMGHRPMMPSVDDQLKHMTEKLNLTDDQQAKIKPILESQRKQMEQIHNDSSLSREDRFSKMQQLRTSGDTQIKAALNDDQQKKFDKMRDEQRSHMHWGGQGPGGQKPEGGPEPQQ